MNKFETIIPVEKIPSVNAAHKIRMAGKKAWLYLDPSIKAVQDRVKEELSKANVQEWANTLDKVEDILYIDIIYCFKKRYWVRDATNLTKYIEDAIAVSIDFNDARNLRVNTEKIYNDHNDDEFIVLSLQPKKLDEVKWKWGQFIE